MRQFITSDGYKFFELPDGSIVDNVDPEKRDIVFDNFSHFDECNEGDYIVLAQKGESK